MRVLITGAAGQVGRALVSTGPSDAEILACTRSDFDIADERAVMSYVRRRMPDVIINAAAHVAPDRAESEVDLARRVNAEGPRFLALAAREVGARMLQISTDYVFDGTSSTPYLPDAPTHPLSVYGITKREGEEAVIRLLPDRSVILRTAWVYSAEGRNFLQTMLAQMRTKRSVNVVVDRVGTPTSATSLAKALWEIVDRPEVTGIHHWTDAGIASWYDFAEAIAEEAVAAGVLSGEVAVHPISASDYPTAARRPAYSVLDKSSLTSLGFQSLHWRKPLRTLLRGMRSAADRLHREHHHV